MEKVSDMISEAMCLGRDALGAVKQFINAIDKIIEMDSSFFVEQYRIELIRHRMSIGTGTDDIYAAFSPLAELYGKTAWLEEEKEKERQ